jgi:hypothetical protein
MSILLAAGVLSAVSVTDTPAAKAATVQTTDHAVKAVTQPLSQVCTPQGVNSMCANREGGGENPGNYVIAWPPGSDNNDFVFESLTGMCNGGKVSADLECPFTPNKGLNAKYNGKIIVQLYNWATGLCAADSGYGTGSTVLGQCGNNSGVGGAYGTIFILSNVTSVIGKTPTTYAVNRYWSNYGGEAGGNGSKARWLCQIGKGSPLYENLSSAVAGSCQWYER